MVASRISDSSAAPDLSVIVPVYNEASSLRELNTRLTGVLNEVPGSFEIVYVDDGSTDDSASLLDSFAACDERVRVIHLTRNFGQHPAVYAGFDHARGQRLATLDADLQNPPEELPKLLEQLEDGIDMVTGVRTQRHDSPLRTIPSRWVNWMVGKLTGVPLRDYGCMLRVYRRSAIEALRSCREQSVYFTALIAWLGVRVREVEIEHEPRRSGQSKYGWWKLIAMNFDLVTGYSILPIQVISIAGIGAAGLGFVLAFVFLLAALFSQSLGAYLGFAMAATFALFGVLLFALGFIGEYIGRVLIEVKGRPPYLVRSSSCGTLRPPARWHTEEPQDAL